MNKKRLTVLLGAGSVKEIGLPQTEKLTDLLINNINFYDNLHQRLWVFFNSNCIHNEKLLNKKKCLLGLIGHSKKQAEIKLNNAFKKKIINFEDLIFAVEELYSANKGNSNYRNHLKDFISIDEKYVKKPEYYIDILNTSIKQIFKKVSKSVNEFDKKKDNEFKWYIEFWKKLSDEYYLDIISLNYDNIFECLIFNKNEYENGFYPFSKNSVFQFNYNKFNNTFKNDYNKHRVIRLHGNINYDVMINYAEARGPGFSAKFDNLEYFEQLDLILFKNKNIYNYTKGNICYFKNNHLFSPIITGFNKEEKMIQEPFCSYYYLLPKIFSQS